MSISAMAVSASSGQDRLSIISRRAQTVLPAPIIATFGTVAPFLLVARRAFAGKHTMRGRSAISHQRGAEPGATAHQLPAASARAGRRC